MTRTAPNPVMPPLVPTSAVLGSKEILSFETLSGGSFSFGGSAAVEEVPPHTASQTHMGMIAIGRLIIHSWREDWQGC